MIVLCRTLEVFMLRSMHYGRARWQIHTSGSAFKRSLLLPTFPKRLCSCRDRLMASCSFMLSSLFHTYPTPRQKRTQFKCVYVTRNKQASPQLNMHSRISRTTCTTIVGHNGCTEQLDSASVDLDIRQQRAKELQLTMEVPQPGFVCWFVNDRYCRVILFWTKLMLHLNNDVQVKR